MKNRTGTDMTAASVWTSYQAGMHVSWTLERPVAASGRSVCREISLSSSQTSLRYTHSIDRIPPIGGRLERPHFVGRARHEDGITRALGVPFHSKCLPRPVGSIAKLGGLPRLTAIRRNVYRGDAAIGPSTAPNFDRSFSYFGV